MMVSNNKQQYPVKVPTMIEMFTGKRIPQQHGNEERCRH